MNSDYGAHYSVPPPPRYMMMENNGSLHPPPHQRNIPRYYSDRRRGGGCSCLRCICCCYCLLFFIIFLAVAAVALFYFLFRPEAPKFSVDSFAVSAFNTSPDFSLYTEFSVTVRAENPNKNVEFDYGDDGTVSILYKEQSLSSGKIPGFFQGKQNTTRFKVLLKGKSPFGSGLQEAMSDNKKSGHIPLNVETKVPVRVKAMGVETRKLYVFVNCSIIVSSLKPNETIKILSTKFEGLGIGLSPK